MADSGRKLGVAIVGLGGAVATTVVAGIELLRRGVIGEEGLPLWQLGAESGLVRYEELVFGGWDLYPDDLATAATTHGVLTQPQIAATQSYLADIRPWPAIADRSFCERILGDNERPEGDLATRVEGIRRDLRNFQSEHDLGPGVVLVNLASTERTPDLAAPVLQSLDSFERGVSEDAAGISPAMLYAYVALSEGIPYVNFTPSVAGEIPALRELSERKGVPQAGKDGKTGQTLLKTGLAPVLRERSLRVAGWYSMNLIGNRDGLALDEAGSLESKLATKKGVLDNLLGYRVDNHVVDIRYYPPRGDAKEAWDAVDIVGFLGREMHIKINFLCRDSILAAPLVIELVRLIDLARRRAEYGIQEHLGFFFKDPLVGNGGPPNHDVRLQAEALRRWLADDATEKD